jgi:hypothetical protein
VYALLTHPPYPSEINPDAHVYFPWVVFWGTLTSDTQSPLESVWKPEAHGGGSTLQAEARAPALTSVSAGEEEVSLIAKLFFNYSLI